MRQYPQFCEGGGHSTALYHLTQTPPKDEFLKFIAKENPDLIAFSFSTDNFHRLKIFVDWIKEKSDIPVICGSYHATLAPEEVLNVQGVDMVCVGEGEYPLLEICDKMAKKESCHNVQNVWVKTNTDIIKNPVRPLMEDLDILPVPDFSLFDFQKLVASKINTVSVMISRGCPYNCSYCSNHAIKNLYPNPAKYTRCRSPKNAINYIKTLIEYCKSVGISVKYISFLDNNLSYPEDWSKEFVTLYAQEINLPFSCNIRAYTVNEELIALFKKAGCFRAHIGLESGNKEIRFSVLKRNMPDDVIKHGFDLCRNANISTLAYNMIGLPGETCKTALDTIKLNSVVRPTRSLAAIFCPYPRTEALRIAVELGLVSLPVDYGKEIILKNKNFTAEQNIFFSLYFRPLVIMYKIIFAFPSFLRKLLEKGLDFVLCWNKLPFGFLNKFMRFYKHSTDSLKNIIRRKSPKFYLFLRNFFLTGSAKLKNQ